MSVHDEIVTALASLPGDAIVYPLEADENAEFDYVVFSEISSTPLQTLQGQTGDRRTTFVFECYGETYTKSIALSEAVRAALLAAASLKPCYEEDSDPDDYIAAMAAGMRPVIFSFWHT